MDEFLRQAIEQRDLLAEKLEVLNRFIADYAPPKPKVVDSDSPKLPIFDDGPKLAPREQRAAAVGATIAEVEAMISSEGRPLTRGDLVRRLEETGHRLDGTDKPKVLGTNLWRSGRFHNLKGAGYWPKGLPLPAEYADLPLRESMID